MPNVTIEVVDRYSRVEEEALIEAVHAALMKALRIPAWDKTIRLVAHAPHRFAFPPDKTDRYLLIDIDLFTGRSLAAKKALYRALVRNLAVLGVPTDHIKILLRESGAENWGIRGGQPASEVNLGFKVDV